MAVGRQSHNIIPFITIQLSRIASRTWWQASAHLSCSSAPQ